MIFYLKYRSWYEYRCPKRRSYIEGGWPCWVLDNDFHRPEICRYLHDNGKGISHFLDIDDKPLYYDSDGDQYYYDSDDDIYYYYDSDEYSDHSENDEYSD